MRTTPARLPDTDGRCPWWSDAYGPLGVTPEEREVADCTIVGAGYTGLACARRLAALRPQWRIVVVDALPVGRGSAGRNSGFVVDVGHWHPGLGVEGNAALARLSRHGLDRLRETAEDCEWSECGRYHVAVNARGIRALATFRAGLDAMGETYEERDGAALASALGTEYYARGLWLPGGALVQPAKLVRSLAASLPESVTLLDALPVQRIEPGAPRTVVTERTRIESRRLVIATNGFARALGPADGRIVPLLTFASLSAPLPEPPGEETQWGAVPEERMGSTVRLTADRRILVRNGVRYHPGMRLQGVEHQTMAAMHARSFRSRFPALGDLKFDDTWCGLLGVTINGGTAFGSFADDAWICAGHNGVGIALGTALGDLLAHTITGESHRLSEVATALPAPGWLPPGPLQAIGLPLYTGLLQILAGSER